MSKIKESQTYREQLSEVENIVKAVSQEDVNLDVLISQVERGYELIKKMRTRLDDTKKKLETLRTEFDQQANEGSA